MKVKSKSHHEATGIEHHHSLTMLKSNDVMFLRTFVQRRPGSQMRSRILSAKKPLHYSKTPCCPDQKP